MSGRNATGGAGLRAYGTRNGTRPTPRPARPAGSEARGGPAGRRQPRPGARATGHAAGPDARLRLPSDPRAVRMARKVVRDLCGVWGDVCSADDAELLVSEVVTNAVVHAGGGSVVLVVRPCRCGMRVEVHDDDAAAVRRRRFDPHATGGRGLQLVAHMAAAWGVRRGRCGKAVWFELAAHPA